MEQFSFFPLQKLFLDIILLLIFSGLLLIYLIFIAFYK